MNENHPNLHLDFDPKLAWALRHPEMFPVDVNTADYEMLLRVPGIGVKSARLIVASRRFSRLGLWQLKQMGIVLKKARYFITCRELPGQTIHELTPQGVARVLAPKGKSKTDERQLTLDFTE